MEKVDFNFKLRNFDCECGKKHICNIKEICINENALSEVRNILNTNGYNHVLLIADINTAPLVVEKLYSDISADNLKVDVYIYENTSLVPDETAIGKLILATNATIEIIIGIGSGTINDLCRYTSFRLNIPYMIIATAPSMDGYASNVSPLIVNGLKTTYEAATPDYIIGDSNILQTAPSIMLSAGFGDIFGKYIALLDWKLSALINNEYYCNYVANITKSTISDCEYILNEDNMPKKIVCQEVMGALVKSGIAMSYVGNSRPASGSEHHLAHFLEMKFLFDNKEPVLHGIKVGFSTLVIIKIYEMLLQEEFDFEYAYEKANKFDINTYCSTMTKVYKHASKEIIEQEKKIKRNSFENTAIRLQLYKNKISDIKSTIKENLPSFENVKNSLVKAGCMVTSKELGISTELLEECIIYAKELRQRYTVLQFVSDLGLLPKYARIIAAEM